MNAGFLVCCLITALAALQFLPPSRRAGQDARRRYLDRSPSQLADGLL
jgi:hypothetical protein